jgi:hypothetical protein
MAVIVPEADLWGCSLRVSIAPEADVGERLPDVCPTSAWI